MIRSNIPIVLTASACWETAHPVNAHQIARRLAARGQRVLFVESTGLRAPSPAGNRHDLHRVLHRLRDMWRPVREVEPRLCVLSPFALPPLGPRRWRDANLRWVAGRIAQAAQRAGWERPVLWSFLPTHWPLADRLAARLLVYHCVDDYTANPGVDAAWLVALEKRMLRRANLVFAASPVLAERLRRERQDVLCFPNVADVELFQRAVNEELPEPVELAALPHPRFVYVGNLAGYRIDFALLLALARSRPDAALVLIGSMGLGDTREPPAAFRELSQLPNVRLLDAKPQTELPAFLRHCDVALIPFLDNAHTRSSLPLKLWEYLAAGLPVVTTALPNFLELAEGSWLRTAADAQAFLHAVSEAALELPAERKPRSERAQAHGWPQRMDELCARIAERLNV